jgi:drug/metabolite transporter (DMT)-like permease
MLLALSAIWGSSFMFIKVGVRELTPGTLIWGRVGLGALALAPVALPRQAVRDTLRRRWRALIVSGLLNTAVPFWTLSWGETKIDSGLAAIIQAAAPIFAAVFAFFAFRDQRSTGLRLVGVLVGFVGVALLVGAQPSGNLLAALAVVFTAACYAAGILHTGGRLGNEAPLAVAFGNLLVATIVTTPLGAAQVPGHLPGWKVVGSVVALGVAGSAVAYLLYFAIAGGSGASRAVLVTYLVPPMAVFYGAVLLGEPVKASALGGLVLILGGVALGTGAVGWRRLALARAR